MGGTSSIVRVVALRAIVVAVAVCCSAALPPFPLEDVVKNATIALSHASKPQPIGFKSSTYLQTVAGIVDFFYNYQMTNGSIIDPYDHRER